ncbi:MAG TPA: PilZ domain-containing protein [Pyrinomonadaceae bacterium]|nr:PilZ domain-containing protein [Pyrinomonadaceae bacterium]
MPLSLRDERPSGDERRRSRRFKAQLPATLDAVLIYSAGRGDDPSGGNLLRLTCRTRDVSEDGLSLVVPAARLASESLPRESCLMLVLLELPGGQVALEAVPMHRRPAGEAKDDANEAGVLHLIGASIKNISERDRALYLSYLDALARADASARF